MFAVIQRKTLRFCCWGTEDAEEYRIEQNVPKTYFITKTLVLEKLIQYTGGSLRDLFHAINASAKRAERRDSETVSMKDAELAIEELKTSLTRRIEK